MLHCGWRGLAAGIIARGVEAIAATDAAIGPGIGPCCYEVGEDVLGAFADIGIDAPGPTLDLTEVARRLLADAGVERVEAAEPLHELRRGALLLPSSRRGRDRTPGGHRLDRGGG